MHPEMRIRQLKRGKKILCYTIDIKLLGHFKISFVAAQNWAFFSDGLHKYCSAALQVLLAAVRHNFIISQLFSPLHMYQVHRKAPQTLQNRALAPEPTCLISFQPLFPTRSRRSFVKRGAFVPFTVRQTKISIGIMAVFLFWRRVDDPTDVTRLA